MSDIALIETVRTTVQELSSLQRAGVTCLSRLRKSYHQDERLQRLARLLEEVQHEAPSAQDMFGDIRCTFCAKSARDVRVVVRAPLAAICDECIVICEGVLRGRRRRFSLRILTDSWRQVTHRDRCDTIVDKLVTIADGIVGRDDPRARLGQLLAEGGFTPWQISYLAHTLALVSAPAVASSDQTTVCSFCRRSDRETFIRAIGAVICNACVKSASLTAGREATMKA
jgi:hypothetical protein